MWRCAMTESSASGAATPGEGRLAALAGPDPSDPASSFYDDPFEESDGDQRADRDWLDQVAADLLSVDMPFERVGVAARTGFTEDEARSVLLDPDRLDLLTTLWRLSPPGPAILAAAVGAGRVADLHRQLLARTGHLARFNARSRYSLAAATGGTAEVLVDDMRPSSDVVITRRIFQGDGLVDIVVESAAIDSGVPFPVMAVLAQHGDEGQAVAILFLLTRSSDADPGGRCEITLPINPLLTGEHLAIYGSPLDATELSGPLLVSVPGSVAAAKRPWKEAWRQAALATGEGHPLRQAVLEGLAARP